jgi:hypothetical protein
MAKVNPLLPAVGDLGCDICATVDRIQPCERDVPRDLGSVQFHSKRSPWQSAIALARSVPQASRALAEERDDCCAMALDAVRAVPSSRSFLNRSMSVKVSRCSSAGAAVWLRPPSNAGMDLVEMRQGRRRIRMSPAVAFASRPTSAVGGRRLSGAARCVRRRSWDILRSEERAGDDGCELIRSHVGSSRPPIGGESRGRRMRIDSLARGIVSSALRRRRRCCLE